MPWQLRDRRDLKSTLALYSLRSRFNRVQKGRELTSHGDSIEGTHGEELMQVLRESSCELKDDEKTETGYHRPFSSVTI